MGERECVYVCVCVCERERERERERREIKSVKFACSVGFRDANIPAEQLPTFSTYSLKYCGSKFRLPYIF